MFKLFKKDKKDSSKESADNEVIYKEYNDEELFSDLKEDGIDLTEQEVQKAQESDKETLFKIGDTYYNNNNNNSKAFVWFYKAALENHDRAQCQIGDMYEKGHGVLVDYKQAMNWYIKAAKNQNVDAMNSIGYLYRNGLGVTKSIRTALEWNTMAANQHYEKVQNNSKSNNENKDEVKILRKAIHYYQKAADNDHEKANKGVKRLSNQEYYTKENQEEEGKKERSIRSDSSINSSTIIEDIRPPSTTSSNDDYFNKLIDDKIKSLEGLFHSKMVLMEKENRESKESLKKELVFLQHEKRQQHEENMRLRQELSKLKTALDDTSDINYDSSDNNNDINYDTEFSEEEEDTNRIDTHQDRIDPGSVENYADPNYNSSDNEDPTKDIYYD